MPTPEICYRCSEEVRTRRWEEMFLDERDLTPLHSGVTAVLGLCSYVSTPCAQC